MKLYVNGDSHSMGAMKDKSTGQSFVNIIADKFNLDVHNQAEHASSAYRIIRTTKEYFSKNSSADTMVLIGWGTWEREEWSHDGKFYNVMEHWYKHLPPDLHERYQVWVKSLNPDLIDEKSRNIHEEIYQLHLYLQELKVPHLFFNCMYNFFGIKDSAQYDWNNCYLGPYDTKLSYYWYLTDRGFESDHWYHFDHTGHRAWADVLINHIEQNKII
jgi:hypothetical protein